MSFEGIFRGIVTENNYVGIQFEDKGEEKEARRILVLTHEYLYDNIHGEEFNKNIHVMHSNAVLSGVLGK